MLTKPGLAQMLAVTHHALEDTFEGAPLNEAYARVILNPILLCLISDEKTRANHQAGPLTEPIIPSATSSTTTPITSPTVPTIDRPITPIQRKELLLQFETELKQPVVYKNERRLLSSFADYSLWYPDENTPSANLIIVEVKKFGTSDSAVGQLLAYMGKLNQYLKLFNIFLLMFAAVVHQTRKDQGKRNTVVYGITTDGSSFRFYQIDIESQVCHILPLTLPLNFINIDVLGVAK
jgi:hypothetical protein